MKNCFGTSPLSIWWTTCTRYKQKLDMSAGIFNKMPFLFSGLKLKNASCSYWIGLWWHAALFVFLLRRSLQGDIEFIRLKTIREHERTRNHLHIRRRSQVRLIGVDITQELVLKRFSNRFPPEKINRFKMSSAIRKLMSCSPQKAAPR